MEITDLDSDDRLRLMRFVCSFAWADLEVADSEKNFVRKMVEELALTADEREEVESYLRVPPAPEDIDPTDIPAEHRQVFLNTALKMVSADGVVDEREVENFALFEQLLR
ncbi:MAG: putative tellurite resistance protein B-like protein [Myxococcota bacterium]|jgi:uncharacterized tellurite resistance protein B-like protein